MVPSGSPGLVLPGEPLGEVRRSFAARLLSPLLDYDRRHQSELVRTLGIFLDRAGPGTPARSGCTHT
ncbi:hypothetical protein GCM10020216_013500 [Nonomuraea helvata]